MDASPSKIFPFILSGGSGTRLWPLSRRAYPKQFLPLIGETSLLQQSCRRLEDALFHAPCVLCNHEHRFLVAEQMREIGITPAEIILEPVARNTAPAALIAALVVGEQDLDGLVLLMPSDHVINDSEGFERSIREGADAAGAGHIVTFGVRPDTPQTGYGYIETQAGTAGVLDVRRFIEKPSKEKAEGYLNEDHFFWNAGIFLYSARAMIDAFKAYVPETLEHCRKSFENAKTDLDFLRLEEVEYAKCENISLDYAIMEKAANIKCVLLKTDWSDLGAWPAIWQHMDKDSEGNVCQGDVILHNVQNSYAHSADGICLTLLGLDNVMAIATKDAILLAAKDHAQDVKHIVEKLQQEERPEADSHMRVYRPWGWYEGLSLGERFQVKCLMVKPGAQLSLQSHHHRAEHWVVVSGTAEVRVDDKKFLLSENESTYIPIGAKHRLGNPGKVPALLIEVQSGAYLKEDDIVRYEDDFGRE